MMLQKALLTASFMESNLALFALSSLFEILPHGERSILVKGYRRRSP